MSLFTRDSLFIIFNIVMFCIIIIRLQLFNVNETNISGGNIAAGAASANWAVNPIDQSFLSDSAAKGNKIKIFS